MELSWRWGVLKHYLKSKVMVTFSFFAQTIGAQQKSFCNDPLGLQSVFLTL